MGQPSKEEYTELHKRHAVRDTGNGALDGGAHCAAGQPAHAHVEEHGVAEVHTCAAYVAHIYTV